MLGRVKKMLGWMNSTE
ncbi:hypothetical protein AZE42_14106 [Rhizopogon vesiculosus]|uniref:Uncharacterized protein n=1 Tax=Rhizopogon vesiculosus TaxID=180088 RepID=A0A1J8R6W8_9AGAM|nr:hypothetical protein AZE42_14106 [Rhizopogon vesiculosus]